MGVVTKFDEGVSRQDCLDALKELSGRDLYNQIEDKYAQVNTTQRNKLASARATQKTVDNGFSTGTHFCIASQIENAWKWAVKIGEYQD